MKPTMPARTAAVAIGFHMIHSPRVESHYLYVDAMPHGRRIVDENLNLRSRQRFAVNTQELKSAMPDGLTFTERHVHLLDLELELHDFVSSSTIEGMSRGRKSSFC